MTSCVSNCFSWIWLPIFLLGAIRTRWKLNCPSIFLDVTICFNTTPSKAGCADHPIVSKATAASGKSSFPPSLNFSNRFLHSILSTSFQILLTVSLPAYHSNRLKICIVKNCGIENCHCVLFSVPHKLSSHSILSCQIQMVIVNNCVGVTLEYY